MLLGLQLLCLLLAAWVADHQIVACYRQLMRVMLTVCVQGIARLVIYACQTSYQVGHYLLSL